MVLPAGRTAAHWLVHGSNARPISEVEALHEPFPERGIYAASTLVGQGDAETA
jgi:hypothetical protein